MSVYCSTFGLGDEHTSECERMTKLSKGAYSVDDSKPCTCGSCPIQYLGSHILPTDNDRRGGYLSLGAIPLHITRDGRDDGPEDGWWPWLRLSVSAKECGGDLDTVLLTRRQVEGFRDALNEWLENSSTAKDLAKTRLGAREQ
jgi:hypothetical protein